MTSFLLFSDLRERGLLTIWLIACISCTAADRRGSQNRDLDHPSMAGAAGAASSIGNSPNGSAGTPGTSIDVDGGIGGAAPCPACSADGRSIVDCNGKLTACAADQLCGAGTCAPPCEAAKINESSVGCEFMSVLPAGFEEGTGSCFAALIANRWTAPIEISVEYAGDSLDVAKLARIPSGSGTGITYQPLPDGKLAPGQLAILFLSQVKTAGALACPAGTEPAVTVNAALRSSGFIKAFKIRTTAPAVAYDIFPYGGKESYVTSATLLIPTPAWGTNYIAVDAAPGPGNPFIQIVAAEPDTQVTIRPTVNVLASGGVPAVAKGTPHTFTLDQAQVLQFNQQKELAGSPIVANKPVAVIGGNSCLYGLLDFSACDTAHQQLAPVKSLGHEYVAVRHRDRAAKVYASHNSDIEYEQEDAAWTLVGAVDGTKLSYDPIQPLGAPDKLDSGEIVRFTSADVFSVRSADAEHPFYLSAHMEGCERVSRPLVEGQCPGDPEYVNVIPPAQWLSSYLFLTDPTYATTNLIFVRQKLYGKFQDVELDCVGTLSGWQPVGKQSTYEYVRLDLVKDGVPQGKCQNGVHTAQSSAPFGLTVWGWDDSVSYAYPAGMLLQKINTVVVPTDVVK